MIFNKLAWWLWRNEWIPLPYWFLPHLLGFCLGSKGQRVKP